MKKSTSIALLCTAALTTTVSQAALQTFSANTANTYAKTKYPIVFVHGMFGFTRLGTDTFGMDYWYQILPDLANNGATVYATQVSPLNSTEVRGEQLLAQVEEIRAITGQNKVNLIGHSHGGPTARYVAAVKPEYVASVTGVGGSFYGSKVADDIVNQPVLNNVLSAVLDKLVAPVIHWAENNTSLPSDTKASLNSISEKGSAIFNQKYPTTALGATCQQQGTATDKGVYYYSWSGRAQTTNLLDVLDSIITVAAPLSYKNLDNDGLVATCNSHLGKVIRDDYYLNHLDEVNMLFGLRSVFSPDPVALYRQHANRLKLQGL